MLERATLTHKTIWIRLPQSPTEFYSKFILEKIRMKLGKLLKIDSCTSTTLRGKYTRLCIQVPLKVLVTTQVAIDNHKQKIIYEGDGILCTICGRIGHTHKNCPHQAQREVNMDHLSSTVAQQISQDDWYIVKFLRRKNINKTGKQGNESHVSHGRIPTNQVTKVAELPGNTQNLLISPMGKNDASTTSKSRTTT